MQSQVTGRALPVLGGALCLDFVNTIDPRLGPPREDFLPTFEALIDWSVFVGAAGPAEAAALAAGAGRDPRQAARVHDRAIEFREALFELLRPPRRIGQPSAALAVVNQELRQALAEAELTPAASNYRLGSRPSTDLGRVLWPIARSAAELLTSAEIDRVGECDGRGCGWLFRDTSKAGRRRWCSMSICGNRAKARRHREGASIRLGGPGPMQNILLCDAIGRHGQGPESRSDLVGLRAPDPRPQ
jgi:predicted RNA-binding Zn ribbon-like protein